MAGNHVNGGTAKGGKHGVMLKSFQKMGDSKGADKKTTLMDFLYTTLRKKRKDSEECAVPFFLFVVAPTLSVVSTGN